MDVQQQYVEALRAMAKAMVAFHGESFIKAESDLQMFLLDDTTLIEDLAEMIKEVV